MIVPDEGDRVACVKDVGVRSTVAVRDGLAVELLANMSTTRPLNEPATPLATLHLMRNESPVFKLNDVLDVTSVPL